MANNSKAFSLIELLIVIAIILIVAAIAVPNLLRSRIAANQASAVSSLRTLNTAEVAYSTTFGSGFSVNMASLAPPAGAGIASSSAAGLIDSVLAMGAKSGYTFTYSPGSSDATGSINTYSLNAGPDNNSTGTDYYYSDQSGIIRMNSTTAASSTDSPLAG